MITEYDPDTACYFCHISYHKRAYLGLGPTRKDAQDACYEAILVYEGTRHAAN